MSWGKQIALCPALQRPCRQTAWTDYVWKPPLSKWEQAETLDEFKAIFAQT
jgi:hypothetical protein